MDSVDLFHKQEFEFIFPIIMKLPMISLPFGSF